MKKKTMRYKNQQHISCWKLSRPSIRLVIRRLLLQLNRIVCAVWFWFLKWQNSQVKFCTNFASTLRCVFVLSALKKRQNPMNNWNIDGNWKFCVLDNVRTKETIAQEIGREKTMWQFNQSACRKHAYIKSLKWYPFGLDSHMRAPIR